MNTRRTESIRSVYCTEKSIMQMKYFLVPLILVCRMDVAISHFLNSVYMQAPLQTCMKLLTYAVITELCPIYGEYSSETVNMLPISNEMETVIWQNTEIIKHCCMKPCTLLDLLSIC